MVDKRYEAGELLATDDLREVSRALAVSLQAGLEKESPQSV